MKRYIKLLLVIVVTLLITGCMKMEINMDIRKDKSMELGLIYAMDDSLLEQSDSNSFDESTKTLKEKGFQVTGYQKEGKTGFEATKTFKNIDDISSDEDVVFDLNKLTEDKNAKTGFKVKKGIFKNHYYAIVKIENSASSITNNRQFREETTNLDEENLDALMQTMDMTFNVNLPYKAIKNNATSTDNNGKTLKWDLTKVKEDMTFEFALYNYRNIYIVGGLILIIILLIVTSIMNKPNTPTIDKKLTNTNMINESHEDNSKVIVDNNQNTNTINNDDDPIVNLNNTGESNDTFNNPVDPVVNNKPSESSTENSDALNDLYNN